MADPRSSHPSWPWLRALLLGFGFCSLVGGRCHSHHDDDFHHQCDDDDLRHQCDDDFDDDDFDDDDVIIIITGDDPAADPWSIAHYRLEVDERTGERSFLDIVGVSMFEALGPGDHAVEDFAGFASGVWERNRDLLGPPGDSSAMKLYSIRAHEEHIVIVFRQIDATGSELIPAAEQSYALDPLGRLVRVVDGTREERSGTGGVGGE